LDSRLIEGHALLHLGHALLALENLAEASDVYEQAIEVQRELGLAHLIAESRAGLARVALALNDHDTAKAYVAEILAHLAHDNLDGAEEPLRVYLTCYRVFSAIHDPHAYDLLLKAHDLLQTRAENISDENLRRSYLENVSVNRDILAEFAAHT
jgi:tetratricopeptide (TPR) repeat protein